MSHRTPTQAYAELHRLMRLDMNNIAPVDGPASERVLNAMRTLPRREVTIADGDGVEGRGFDCDRSAEVEDELGDRWDGLS